MFVPELISCMPREVTFINHRISMEMVRRDMKAVPVDNGTYVSIKHSNVSYFVIPRSSISKTPLMLANSIGLIDAGYRGSIFAPVYNTSDSPYVVHKGTKLFQVILPSLEHFDIEFVDSLSETERGDKGFGSSS